MTIPRPTASAALRAAVALALSACNPLAASASAGEADQRVPAMLRGSVSGAMAEPAAAIPLPPAPAAPAIADDGDDPYAPLGLRAGGVFFFPSFELRAGRTDNIRRTARGRIAASYTRVMPELELRSDWSRHEVMGRVAAEFERASDGWSNDTRALDVELAGRIDIDALTALSLAGRHVRAPEALGTPGVPATAAVAPEIETWRGAGELARTFGRLRASVRGFHERVRHEDVPLVGGGTSDFSERDYRQQQGALRAAYEVGGGSAVFAEGGAGRRVNDRRIDSAGILRGSRGSEVLAGVTFDRGGPLAGEVGAGYYRLRPDDARLPDISGILLRGALAWRPGALTTLTLEGALEPREDVIDATSAGARYGFVALGLAHELRRNLILTGRFALGRADYVGSPRRETTFEAEAGIEYLVNRWLSLTAAVGHEKLDSNVPGDGYEANRVEVGVRVRR